MTNSFLPTSSLFLALVFGCCVSCSGQPKPELLSQSQPGAVHATQSATKEIKSYGRTQSVSCGLLDKDGYLWFGTNHEGVYRYASEALRKPGEQAFTNYSMADGLCSKRINCIMEDDDGDLWFGTPEGLAHYDGNAFNHIPLPWRDTSSAWLDQVYPVVNPNGVRSLLQASYGAIWVGTNGGGAYRYDGATFTPFLADVGRKQTDGLFHNVVSSVIEDKAGNVWFTSMIHGGISCYDGNKMVHYTLENGLKDDMIFSAHKGRDGVLWFGALGNREGGLQRYDGTAFTNLNEADGLCNNNIVSIHEDGSGKLWLASNRGELCIYDPLVPSGSESHAFSAFTGENGNTFRNIIFVIGDGAGSMWFGGMHGQLFRYDGSALTDFTQKQITK